MSQFPNEKDTLPFRRAILDALIILFLYVFCVSVPAFGPYSQTDITNGLRLLFVLPCACFLLYEGFRFKLFSLSRLLLCLPLILVSFGNITALLVSGGSLFMEAGSILPTFLGTLATALGEELVFRFALLTAFEKKENLRPWAIPLSALIFGASHLLPILGGASISGCLIQAGYTFLLGLALGVAYSVSGLSVCVLIHFVFNFYQTDLYVSSGGGNWDRNFVIFNVIFSVLVGFYAVFLFFRFVWKRQK